MSSNRHSFPPAIPRGESSYRGNYLMGRQNSRLVEPISSGSMQPSYRGYGSEDRGSFSQSNTNNRKRVGVAVSYSSIHIDHSYFDHVLVCSLPEEKDKMLWRSR